jgi:hypothetical protein
MAQTLARSAHLVLAWLFVLGVLVQVFLAGLAVFSDGAVFATHRDFGYTLSLLPVLLLVTALLGRLGRGHALAAVVLFGLFILQSVLVALRESAPVVAALHPVNGFIILLVGVGVARDAVVRRRAVGASAAEAPPAQSPAG